MAIWLNKDSKVIVQGMTGATGMKHTKLMLGDTATKPLVVRLDGNAVEEGRRILEARNHPLVTLVDTMDGAADKAAELANAQGA